MQGDLSDAAALSTLLEGSSAIIHSAGSVRGNSQADFDRTNVAGSAALLKAVALHTQPLRFLLISSLAASEPGLSYYSRSKRTGEEQLTPYANLDWLIIRPPAVYGPGDKEMLPVFKLMYRGVAFVPGALDARLSLIHVHDLVNAIITSLRCEDTRHQTLHLHDGRHQGYDWHEIAAIAEDVWGRRVRLLPLPKRALDSVASLNSLRARVIGGAPMLTPAKVRELRHPNWVVDNQHITALTGWEPSIELPQGLELLNIPAL